MNSAKLLLVICSLVIASHQPSLSQQNRASNEQALNNFHHELTTCFVYFSIAQQCTANRGDTESLSFAQSFEPVKERLNTYRFVIGKQIQMSQDAQVSRQAIEMKEMLNLIQNSCVNISSLFSRYAYRCKLVAEKPEHALAEWLAK